MHTTATTTPNTRAWEGSEDMKTRLKTVFWWVWLPWLCVLFRAAPYIMKSSRLLCQLSRAQALCPLPLNPNAKDPQPKATTARVLPALWCETSDCFSGIASLRQAATILRWSWFKASELYILSLCFAPRQADSLQTQPLKAAGCHLRPGLGFRVQRLGLPRHRTFCKKVSF